MNTIDFSELETRHTAQKVKKKGKEHQRNTTKSKSRNNSFPIFKFQPTSFSRGVVVQTQLNNSKPYTTAFFFFLNEKQKYNMIIGGSILYPSPNVAQKKALRMLATESTTSTLSFGYQRYQPEAVPRIKVATSYHNTINQK